MTTTPSTTVLSPQAAAYLAAINAPGVNVIDVEWESTVKPAAAHKAHTLTKRVNATVMTGQEFKNLSVNNDRETGELPWGEWAVYPYIIVHKGAEYVRLNTIDGTVKAAHYIDGQRVKREEFDAMLTPSARESKRPTGGTVTVKLAGVTVL